MTENISIPPGRDASPSQVTHQLMPVPIYTPGWRVAMSDKVPCPRAHAPQPQAGLEPTTCRITRIYVGVMLIYVHHGLISVFACLGGTEHAVHTPLGRRNSHLKLTSSQRKIITAIKTPHYLVLAKNLIAK